MTPEEATFEKLGSQFGVSFGQVPRELKNVPRLGWAVSPAGADPFNQETLIDHLHAVDFILLDAECFRLSDCARILSRIPPSLLQGGTVILHGPEAEAAGASSEPLGLLRWAHELRAVRGLEFAGELARDGTRFLIFRNFNPTSPLPEGVVPKDLEIRDLFYRLGDRLEGRLAGKPELSRKLSRTLRLGWRVLKRVRSLR